MRKQGDRGFGVSGVHVPTKTDMVAVESPWARPAPWRRLARLLGGRWVTAGELCAVMQRIAPHSLPPGGIGRGLVRWASGRSATVGVALGAVKLVAPVTVEVQLAARGAVYRLTAPGYDYDAEEGEVELEAVLARCVTVEDFGFLVRALSEGEPHEVLSAVVARLRAEGQERGV